MWEFELLLIPPSPENWDYEFILPFMSPFMWVLAQCTLYSSHSCYFILIHWLFRMVSNSQIQLFTLKWCFDWPGMFWNGDRISLLFLKALCQSDSCHNLSKILIYQSSPSIHIVISSHVIHLCRVSCTSFVHWSLCWTQEPATSLGKYPLCMFLEPQRAHQYIGVPHIWL